MPCHHSLGEALHAYINAAGIAEDRKGWLFRTARDHDGKALSHNPMAQPDAWQTIRRRAAAPGSLRRLAAIPCVRRGLRPISRMGAPSTSKRRKWPRTRARVLPSSMIVQKNALPKTR
jgi:hypothetical protein